MPERIANGAADPASFRDPAGFVFVNNGDIYRQINSSYRPHYDFLRESGLYDNLTGSAALIEHSDVTGNWVCPDAACAIIKPRRVPFLSYPYEWSFSQLKDAALLTLDIQRRALEAGMSLKDASAYNVQFVDGRPILIDTLSFEIYRENRPWAAYRQFCRHFLGPLALMAYSDIRLGQLLRVNLDGLPLDMVSQLLPWRACLKLGNLTHLVLHSRSERRYGRRPVNGTSIGMSKRAQLGLIDSLESAVRRLRWRPRGTEWADYYSDTNYSDDAARHKKDLVRMYLRQARPSTVWDLGANNGAYSRLAVKAGAATVAFDVDPAAVEKNYLRAAADGERLLLPLALDLTNPSPDQGWGSAERRSLLKRGPADLVMALALVHHLAIGANIPLPRLAEFLAGLCRWLIIEFVPKSDSQVQRLLSCREDIFPDYHQKAFEEAMTAGFTIENSRKIKDSERTLYLLRRR